MKRGEGENSHTGRLRLKNQTIGHSTHSRQATTRHTHAHTQGKKKQWKNENTHKDKLNIILVDDIFFSLCFRLLVQLGTDLIAEHLAPLDLAASDGKDTTKCLERGVGHDRVVFRDSSLVLVLGLLDGSDDGRGGRLGVLRESIKWKRGVSQFGSFKKKKKKKKKKNKKINKKKKKKKKKNNKKINKKKKSLDVRQW